MITFSSRPMKNTRINNFITLLGQKKNKKKLITHSLVAWNAFSIERKSIPSNQRMRKIFCALKVL